LYIHDNMTRKESNMCTAYFIHLLVYTSTIVTPELVNLCYWRFSILTTKSNLLLYDKILSLKSSTYGWGSTVYQKNSSIE